MGRNNEIRIKFNKEEVEKVNRKAKELGLTISAFMRFVALKSKINVESA